MKKAIFTSLTNLVRDTDFEKITNNLLTAYKKCFKHFWSTILCLSDWQRYKEHVWYQKHTLKMRKKCSRDIQTMFMKNHTSFFWNSGMGWDEIRDLQKKDTWNFMNEVWLSPEHFLRILKLCFGYQICSL